MVCIFYIVHILTPMRPINKPTPTDPNFSTYFVCMSVSLFSCFCSEIFFSQVLSLMVNIKTSVEDEQKTDKYKYTHTSNKPLSFPQTEWVVKRRGEKKKKKYDVVFRISLGIDCTKGIQYGQTNVLRQIESIIVVRYSLIEYTQDARQQKEVKL